MDEQDARGQEAILASVLNSADNPSLRLRQLVVLAGDNGRFPYRPRPDQRP